MATQNDQPAGNGLVAKFTVSDLLALLVALVLIEAGLILALIMEVK